MSAGCDGARKNSFLPFSTGSFRWRKHAPVTHSPWMSSQLGRMSSLERLAEWIHFIGFAPKGDVYFRRRSPQSNLIAFRASGREHFFDWAVSRRGNQRSVSDANLLRCSISLNFASSQRLRGRSLPSFGLRQTRWRAERPGRDSHRSAYWSRRWSHGPCHCRHSVRRQGRRLCKRESPYPLRFDYDDDHHVYIDVHIDRHGALNKSQHRFRAGYREMPGMQSRPLSGLDPVSGHECLE